MQPSSLKHQQSSDKMVSFRDYEIYLFFLLLVKFYGSGKCEIFSPLRRILQCFLPCAILTLDAETPTLYFRTWCSSKWFPNYKVVFDSFCISKFWYDDAIEINSKGFYASSVPYVQNLTSKLKLRSALFSWLVWVLFLAMRKVTALSVGFHYKHGGYANPEKSCHLYINSLPCYPSVIITVANFSTHHWFKQLPQQRIIAAS